MSPAALPKADFEEILSYQRRLAQARKAVAGLETSIPNASPDTVDTLRQALDAGQERIRYLEGRLRDGTSERAEAAAAKAQVAAEKARADAARVAQRETARADREAKRSALAAERIRAAEERARQKAERDAKRAADREERARIAAEKQAARVRPEGIGPNGKPVAVPDPVPDVVPDLAPAIADADRPASRLRATLTQIRTVVGQVVRAIRREMPGALAATQNQGRKAFRGLRSSLSAFQTRVGSVQAQVGDLFQSVPGRLRSALLASTAALVGAIRDPVGAVRNAVAGTAHLATATLTSLAVTAQRVGSTSVRSFVGLGSTIATSFRQIGPLTLSALGAVRSGLSSIGPAATSALSRIPALAGAAGRGLRNSLLKDVHLVGSVIGGLGRAVVAGLAGIPRAIGAAGRAFAGLARAGASAFRALARAGAGVASGLVRTFAGAASGILRVMTSKITLISAALIGLGDLTVRAVKGFAPLLGLAGGVAGVVAGVVTMKDVEAVRQLSDALNLSPQIVSQWQFMGAALGAASDDVLGAMQALGTTMTALANGDESVKPVAELFKQLGISVSTAEGRFKSVSQMMSELAVRSRHLDAETRNHLFAAIFGEADALKLSSMFKAIGDDYERLNARMASNEAKGLLVTPEQMETLSAFQARWSEFLFTLKALARELFLAFEPIFSQFIKFATLKLEMPGQRGNFIQKVFVQPFERAWKLTRDIMQAWAGFDFDAWFTGASSGGVAPENMWLYDVKKAAVDTYLVVRGLIDLVYGAVGAFVSLFRAVDDVVMRLTGFSFEGWALTDGPADFRAFAADARQILSTLFDAPIDPSKMTTGLGKALAGSVNNLKGVVTPIWRSVVDDLLAGWTEFQNALGDDRPLASMETWTGTILKILNDLREDLVAFGRAFWTVFVDDQPAPEQFSWLNDVRTIFEGLGTAISGVAEALRLLAPAYDVLNGVSQSLFGISAATTLLLGGGLLRLGTMFGGLAASLLPAGAGAGLAALLAGIAAPLAVVALKVGLVVGAVYLLYNLLTDFTGTIDRIVGALSKAWSFLAGKDEGDPGFLGAAAQRLGLMEEPADRVRRESDQWLADREASRERMKALADPAARTAMTQELARQETQQPTQVAQTAEIEAGNVEVKASGRPIVLQLPEGDVELYGTEDAADRLLRSRALTAGGTR